MARRRFISVPPRFKTSLYAPLIAVLSISGILISCSLEDWTPRGEISLIQVYDTDDSYYSGANLVFRIVNTGKSSIEQSIASLRWKTNMDLYHLSLHCAQLIPSGQSVYTELNVAYRHIDELGEAKDLIIESAFFE